MGALVWGLEHSFSSMLMNTAFCIPLKSRKAVKMLDKCLEVVMDWIESNKLSLNPAKMEVLWGVVPVSGN